MLRYGYFDSEIIGTDSEGMPIFDRAETSDLFRLLFAKLISNGVLADPGDCFQVLASEGLTISVRPGFGLIQGAFAYDEAAAAFTLATAPQQYARVDRVVLRANYANRCCEIVVKTGDVAANPVPPELLQPASGDYYELSLATIYVAANATAVTQSSITDTRGDSSVCGYITQLIDHLDTSVFSAQLNAFFEEYRKKANADLADGIRRRDADIESFQSTFTTWFNNVKGQLSTDQAGQLQTQLDALKEKHDKDIDIVTKKLITLTITTDDDDLIGDIIKVTKGDTILEQTFGASKALAFHLPELGTWTVTNTNPDHSGSSEITCEMYGRYSVTLSGGFNWKKWVTDGGLNADGYASFTDVLADEKAIRQLMTKHASADILAKAVIENRAGFRSKITASKTAMKWIGLRDYICDKLLADAETQSDLLASDHWRYILKDGVPYMTSDTAPYGTATNGGTNIGKAYKAFINDASNGPDMGYGNDGNTANTWVQYKFVTPICVKRIRVKAPKEDGRYYVKTFKVQYSNDGSTFKDIESDKYAFTNTVREIEENVNNDNYASYWRVQAVSTNGNMKGYFTNVRFYGRQLSVSVPTMTSDTAPWGKIIYSSQWDGGSSAGRQAFSGADSPWYPSLSDSSGKAYIGYVYPTPTRVRQATFICHNGDQTETCVVERSDDGERWEKASDEIRITVDNETKILNVDASPARYWRIRNVSGNIYVANHGGFNLRKVQFYGVDYSERDDRAYIYDHGMELTPLNVKIVDGTIPLNPPEKKETYIQLTAPSGKSCGVGVAIDVTNLKRLRAVTDQGTFNVGAEFGRFFATTEGNTQAYIAYASASAPPYNHSLDLTSITGVKTLVHLVWSGLSTGLSEMWLE